MTDAKQRLSVLLDDPTNLALMLGPISKVVADALGEHQTDVSQRIRYSGGILVRDAPEPIARQVARGLAGIKLGSFLVPRTAFKAAPRPKRLGALQFDREGIRIGLPLRPDKLTTWPWASVRAINAHALDDEPGSEEREGGLPKRGGNLRDLHPDTRRLLNEIREHEAKERTVVRPGLDLLLGDGPDLYRLGYGDAGIYGGLDLAPLPEEALMRASWEAVAQAGDAARGKWLEWDGVVIAVKDAKAGLLEVGERQQGATQVVRLRLADPADVRLRRLEPGVPVAWRGRIDGWDGQTLTLGDGALRRGTHSLENYLLLVRKLVQLAPPSVMVPPTTRRFAERATIGDIVFAKREEMDAFSAWIVQALGHGIRFGEAEELGDEGLVDGDEAVLVADGGEEAEDVSDAELEDDPSASARLAATVSSQEEVMQHFAKTGRLDARHVKELLADAAALDTLEEDAAGGADDPEVAEAMSFFDAKSGQWRLKDVLSGQDELEKLDEETDAKS